MSGDDARHGFDDDAATRALLRSPPSSAALAWVTATVNRDDERCFIHRDFHPGNVLWRRGRVSGVVDWQSACVGPPAVDIAHCRANLLRYAPGLADWFTQLAEQTTARPLHPWADIAALIGMLDGLRDTPPRPAGRAAIEKALEDATRALR